LQPPAFPESRIPMKHARNLRWCGTLAVLTALVLFAVSAAASFHSHAGSSADACLVCQVHDTPAIAASAIVLTGPPHQAGASVVAVSVRSLFSPLTANTDGRAPPARA
jgi:hypothetical protein